MLDPLASGTRLRTESTPSVGRNRGSRQRHSPMTPRSNRLPWHSAENEIKLVARGLNANGGMEKQR
jgi:hypothetical protein